MGRFVKKQCYSSYMPLLTKADHPDSSQQIQHFQKLTPLPFLPNLLHYLTYEKLQLTHVKWNNVCEVLNRCQQHSRSNRRWLRSFYSQLLGMLGSNSALLC